MGANPLPTLDLDYPMKCLGSCMTYISWMVKIIELYLTKISPTKALPVGLLKSVPWTSVFNYLCLVSGKVSIVRSLVL